MLWISSMYLPWLVVHVTPFLLDYIVVKCVVTGMIMNCRLNHTTSAFLQI